MPIIGRDRVAIRSGDAAIVTPVDGAGSSLMVLPSYGRDGGADFDDLTARAIGDGWRVLRPQPRTAVPVKPAPLALRAGVPRSARRDRIASGFGRSAERPPDRGVTSVESDDRLDMMTLFLKVADTGRLAESSRQLGLSQPVASRMLRRLERRLKSELVRRSTRGLILTDAGRRFADTARAMLDQWQHAARSLDEDPDNLAGPIRILVPVAVGQNLLAAIFAAFGRKNPGVVIDCELRDDSVDLSSQGFDLQIRAGPVVHQSLIVREIWEVDRTVVAAAGHPAVAHPADLCAHPAVRLTTFVPQTIEMTRHDGETALLRHRSVFTTDNLYAALTAAREGLGYAVVPLWAMQRLIHSGDLVRLCPEWHPPKVILSLVYPPSPSHKAALAGGVPRSDASGPLTGVAGDHLAGLLEVR